MAFAMDSSERGRVYCATYNRDFGFNIFNHTNFTTVQTQLASRNYGQATGTGTPRVLQLGAKVQF
jgi:hypothetical protein